jgi:imidazolonepropionase-like amidohydrolase
MFSKRHLGRIKDGYEANFFVVPSDPLNTFENVKDVRRVFKNGEELARE